MAGPFLSVDGLSLYDSLIKSKAMGNATIAGRTVTFFNVNGAELCTVEIPQSIYNLATSTEQGLMSAAQFNKLEGISEGATKVEASGTNGKVKVNGSDVTVYNHPSHSALASGFYKVTVDSSGHVTAGSKVTKSDITALGIPSENTTYSVASASADGLMSKSDFSKLAGVSGGANKVEQSATNGNIKIDGSDTIVYKHDAHTAYSSNLYKVTVNAQGHVTAATAVAKSDIVALGIPSENTTYDVASASANGLMSSTDFSKLKGVATGAQVNVLEKVSVNGTALAVSSKGVNIDLSNYALKSDVANAVEYQGSVASFDKLPANASKGDMYNVEAAWTSGGKSYDAGTNVVYNGTEWDAMATMFDVSAIPNSEIEALFA